ncbi:hypothetical protein B5E80_17950 [Flavonifractor sp. An135]|nr:hypothetical protein B5E80_17950 [Flavonifractor sp. An135]
MSCRELLEAAQEYQVRELCFWICVNMIANAIGRCEVRTFRGGEEIHERDYYLWNVSPNVNQNSTAFWRKLVARLYQDNEALIVPALTRADGMDALVVADDWAEPEEWPSRQNEYRDVRVGEYTYQYPFYENNVIHLKLHHRHMAPVLNGLYQSYWRLIEAARRDYEWNHGQHWKVRVDQVASGDDGWEESFQAMMTAQLKPFLESNGAVLPEFDGYAYEKVGDRSGDTRDIRALIEDIFEFTARGFLIPAVLVSGKIEGTQDANARFLTACIDPLCDQLQEEITRKRYGYAAWQAGDYVKVDSSSILHFDLFANAANVEKLVGSAAFSVNDLLRAANQPTIDEPWADAHFLTKNISTMDDVARQLPREE